MIDQRFSTAVHIMTVLAFQKCENGNLYTSELLAKSLRTNATVIRRVVARLVDAGLVKSYKGKSGGIQLGKCPGDISLRSIYEAVTEKNLISSPDRKSLKACPVSCSMGALMGEVIEGVEMNSKKYLEGISLKDLSARIEA